MADRHAARHADLPALSALATPLRRRLYAHVAAAETTTRDDAALAVGISRSLAAYHLDRLVSLGVLEIDRERIRRVGGPGAGRPPKRYRRARGGPVATESARAALLAVLTAQGYAPLE